MIILAASILLAIASGSFDMGAIFTFYRCGELQGGHTKKSLDLTPPEELLIETWHEGLRR